jgi:two-component system, OmpR family, sensor kinase
MSRWLSFPSRLPLRWRLALGYAVMMTAILAAVGIYLLSTLESNLLQEADEALGLRSFHVERSITSEGGDLGTQTQVAAAITELAPSEEYSAPGIYIQVLDWQGGVLASSPNLPTGQLPGAFALAQRAFSGQEAIATVPTGLDRVRILAHPIQVDGRVAGVLLVGESLHTVDVALRRVQQLLGAAAAVAAAGALLGGWWLTSRALMPITEVTRVARRIASTRHFEERIGVPPTRDELGELTETFNDMLDQLAQTFDRQREFLANASHELRGPLTVLRGNLDLLGLELSQQDRLDSAREASEEVDRMSHLVSDLLFLSEVDAQETVEHQPVALHALLLDIQHRLKGVDAGAHDLVVDQNEPTFVSGDRDRLEQMLSNLVDNALRYTPTGGRVSLSLRNNGQVAELTVSDTGIGIPEEHIPHIFERFYRVDRARSRNQKSTGLGLAIVKQIANAHGGQVRVRSHPEEGTTFTVALPVLKSRPSGNLQRI